MLDPFKECDKANAYPPWNLATTWDIVILAIDRHCKSVKSSLIDRSPVVAPIAGLLDQRMRNDLAVTQSYNSGPAQNFIRANSIHVHPGPHTVSVL